MKRTNKKAVEFRKQLAEKIAACKALEVAANAKWHEAGRIKDEIEELKVLIVGRERLLAGKWTFVQMDEHQITFRSHYSNLREFAKLFDTDSHGEYCYFKIEGESVHLRHDDGDLTITFGLKQFGRMAHLLGGFKIDLDEIRSGIARAIEKRAELEQIEEFIEDVMARRSEKARDKKTKKVKK